MSLANEIRCRHRAPVFAFEHVALVAAKRGCSHGIVDSLDGGVARQALSDPEFNSFADQGRHDANHHVDHQLDDAGLFARAEIEPVLAEDG